MYDVELRLSNQPGELARMGQALAAVGISVEGGAMFLANGVGVAHFLVADGDTARSALQTTGLSVTTCREVLALRLRQDQPGQLGRLGGAMASAGVNIETLYSDHDGHLILLVDEITAAQRVRDEWTRAYDTSERTPAQPSD
jgi:hypothetical protein